MRHHFAFDQYAQIVPAIFGRRGEIIIGDVKSSDQRTCIVCDDDLLVVADQEPAGPFRAEQPYMASDLLERLEHGGITRHPEPVDNQFDLDSTLCSINQSCQHVQAGRVIVKNVKRQAKRCRSTFNQLE